MWKSKLVLSIGILSNPNYLHAGSLPSKNLRVIGVIESLQSEKESVAVVKDLKAKKTYILKVNQRLPSNKNYTLKKISSKGIILSNKMLNFKIPYIEQDRSLYAEIKHLNPSVIQQRLTEDSADEVWKDITESDFDFNKWLQKLREEEQNEESFDNEP